jgi:autotransporter-associated beta strand protein
MRNSDTSSVWESILNRLGFQRRGKRRKGKAIESVKRRTLRPEQLEERALLTVLTWDPDGLNNGVFGGSGSWTAPGAWVNTSTGQRITWNSSRTGDTAIFTGARGDIQITATGIKAAKLIFQGLEEENGYCIYNQPLTLTGSGVTIESSQKRLVIASDIINTTADQSWSIASGKWFEFYGAATFTGRSLYVEGDVRFMGAGETHSGWAFRTRYGGVATFTTGNLNCAYVIVGNWSQGTINWLSGGTLTANSLSFDTGPSVFYQTVGKVKLNDDVQFVCPGTYYLYGVTAELWTPAFNTAYGGSVPSGSQICFNEGRLIAKASMSIDAGLSYYFAGGNGIFETRGYNVTLNGGLSGPGGLVKASSGTLTVNGFGAYTGSTYSVSGTLVFGNALAAQNSTLNLSAGFTGNISFGTLSVATIGGLVGERALSLQNASGAGILLHVGVNGTDTTYAGVLSGIGGLAKVGSGVLTLTGANTYTGVTKISGGTLCFASGGLGTTGTILFSEGTLQWASGNTQDISGRLVASFYDTYSTFDVGVNSVTFATPIQGYGNLCKKGTGTLTLTGANTYLGTTSVDEGALVFNGTIPQSSYGATEGAFYVNDGGTLAGTGTIDRDVYVFAGGILSPGGIGTGTLTVGCVSGQGLTLNSGSTFRVDTNSGRPGTCDQVVVRGGVSLDSNAVLLPATATGPGAGSSLTIIDNDGSDAVSGTFSNGYSLLVGDVLMTINYNGGDGNDVVLTC